MMLPTGRVQLSSGDHRSGRAAAAEWGRDHNPGGGALRRVTSHDLKRRHSPRGASWAVFLRTDGSRKAVTCAITTVDSVQFSQPHPAARSPEMWSHSAKAAIRPGIETESAKDAWTYGRGAESELDERDSRGPATRNVTICSVFLPNNEINFQRQHSEAASQPVTQCR
jgi:hypothetical protein